MDSPSSSTAATSSSSPRRPISAAHVTHEAVEKIGGIGTVLEGLITSHEYQRAVGRTILVGPMWGDMIRRPAAHLGHVADVRYSSTDNITSEGLGRRLRPIEWAFDTPLVYGVRQFREDVDGRVGQAEMLLVNVSNPNRERLNQFKFRLWERFGLDAARYEGDWSFEEYTRLAEPAFYALSALLRDDQLPCVIFSHEYMGMPAALKAVMDGHDAFRTIFHAHECATARKIVEEHPGHDTSFYNVLRLAAEKNQSVEEIYGSQDHMRHELISRSHHLDGIAAVGDYTAEELRFLSPEMRRAKIDVVYNGVPSAPVTIEAKLSSRRLIDDWAERIAGFRPDILITHVARPVVSKGFWRDVKVAQALDPVLKERGQRGLLIILTCGAPVRSFEQVEHMHREYGWPGAHREGFPDLSGPEVGMWRAFEGANKTLENVRIVFVNQFGFSRDTLGSSLPAETGFADLRRAADVELGMSTYEPFGIAQFEPLSAGGICVVTNVCGCVGLFRHAAREVGVDPDDHPNFVVADFTELNDRQDWPMSHLLRLSQTERDQVEDRVSRRIAEELIRRLPRNDDDRAKLLASGRMVAARMGWDTILSNMLAPMLTQRTSPPPSDESTSPTHTP